eukprot:1048181-Rhodomonas_salina.4
MHRFSSRVPGYPVPGYPRGTSVPRYPGRATTRTARRKEMSRLCGGETRFTLKSGQVTVANS